MKIKDTCIVILILTIFTLPLYAQEALKLLRINDFTGGMNSYSVPEHLELKQGASMANVVLSRPGRLSKRKGQGLFNRDVGNTAFRGIGRFDPDATTSYLVAASGTKVIRSESSSSSWTIANPSNALTSGNNTEFVQADKNLFILNGFDTTGWYNGSLWTDSVAYPTSPPSATTGAWLRNYLFLAGATTETDWVYFSNNLDPRVFDATDIIKINTGDGQPVKHLEPYRLNELIIYKSKSIFVLNISGSTPLDDWTVQPISTSIGVDAPRSVVSLGNDQWFLSSEPIAVRSLVRSQFDKILVDMVSRPIQDIFDGSGIVTINKNQINKAAAILFDDKYILAIPVGTSTVNNMVVVFDFLTQAWYRIYGWFPADWVEYDNRLFYIDANDGRVIECFTGTTGDWLEGPNFIDSSSSPTVGTNFVFISKTLDWDLPEMYKELDSIEVEFDPTGDYNATLHIALDENGWVSIGTTNLAGNTLTLPFTLPSELSNAGVAKKTYQLDDQGEFRKMKVMIQQGGVSEEVILQRVTIFPVPKAWRRED